MKLNDSQERQLAMLIGCIFEEIRNRCPEKDFVADLAYASHNLSDLGLNEHLNAAHFEQSFARFHEEHGYGMFDFVAMLSTLEEGKSVGAVTATAEQRAANPPKWNHPTALPTTIRVRPARG